MPLWLPFLLLMPCLALAGLFDGARLLNPELGRVLTSKLPAGLLRPEEAKRMSGTFWYLLGVELVLGVSALCASRRSETARRVATLAIMYLAWADPVAALVGRRYGRVRPAWMGGKSFEGTAAAGLAGAAITAGFLGLPYTAVSVLQGGVIVAFSEGVNVLLGLDDNLVMPCMAAILLRLFLLPL